MIQLTKSEKIFSKEYSHLGTTMLRTKSVNNVEGFKHLKNCKTLQKYVSMEKDI